MIVSEWERSGPLPPGLPRSFCRVIIAPEKTLDGIDSPGGFVKLCRKLVVIVNEDSSTPNRINAYGLLLCDGCELVNPGPVWVSAQHGE